MAVPIASPMSVTITSIIHMSAPRKARAEVRFGPARARSAQAADREAERRPLSLPARHDDAAPVGLDQALHDRQPQAESAAVGPRRLPEAIEEMRDVLRADAGARIGHAEPHGAVLRFRRYREGAARRRELDRVAHEVR